MSRMTKVLALAALLALLTGALPSGSWNALGPAAASSHAASLDDDAGDATPFGFRAETAPGAPRNALSDEVDLVRVFVDGETLTGFELGFQVAGFDAARDATRGNVQSPFYEVDFELSSDPGAGWRLSLGGCFLCLGDDRSADLRVDWSLCRRPSAEDFSSDCWSAGTPATVDRATATVRFPLDRLLLAELAGGEAPMRGDQVTVSMVRTQGVGFLGDRAPEDGEPPLSFAFADDTANQRLVLAFPEQGADHEAEDAVRFGYGRASREPARVGIEPGGQLMLPLTVHNRMDSRKLIQVSAALDAEDAALWSVTAPPTLAVPAGGFVTANLLLGTDAALAPGRSAALAVRASPVGDTDTVGLAEALLVATATPGPAANVLHLHSARGDGITFVGQDQLRAAGLELFDRYRLALSLLDDDPAYEDMDVPLLGVEAGRTTRWAELEVPLAKDLRFDLRGNGTVDLFLLSRQTTRDLRIDADLFVGEVHVGGGSVTATATPTGGVHAVPFAPRLERETVSAAEGAVALSLRVRDLGPTAPPFSLFGSDSLVPLVWLRPAESSVTLPLLPLAPTRLTASTGQHLLSLALKDGKDPEEYVNPGRGLLFNFSLGNQGTANDTVLLSLNQSGGEGWFLALLPTKRVRLGSGEFANATLVVRAPEGAPEGARLAVDVVAESVGDRNARAVMRLAVTATQGIDIPDEGLAPAVGAKGKASKDSPGAGAFGLAVAVALGLVLARRGPPRALRGRPGDNEV